MCFSASSAFVVPEIERTSTTQKCNVDMFPVTVQQQQKALTLLSRIDVGSVWWSNQSYTEIRFAKCAVIPHGGFVCHLVQWLGLGETRMQTSKFDQHTNYPRYYHCRNQENTTSNFVNGFACVSVWKQIEKQDQWFLFHCYLWKSETWSISSVTVYDVQAKCSWKRKFSSIQFTLSIYHDDIALLG